MSMRLNNAKLLAVVQVGFILLSGCATKNAGTISNPNLGEVKSTVLLNAPAVSYRDAALGAAATARDSQDVEKTEALNTGLAQLQADGLGAANIPVAQSYLDQLLRRVQSAGPQPPIPSKVVIWPRLTYNAYCRPEGLIVVDLGWLKDIGSEAELVALLAHEYGHLVKGHGAGGRKLIGTSLYLAQRFASAKLQANLGSGLAASITINGWTNVINPGWSRSQEFEADAFSLEITRAMGIPFATGIKSFLERVQSIEAKAKVAGKIDEAKQDVSSALDNHPSPSERLAKIRVLNEGAPRIKATSSAKDPWRAIVNTDAFKFAEAEYVVMAPMEEFIRLGQKDRFAAAVQKLAKLPHPYRTSAAMSVAAVTARKFDDSSLATLKKATEAQDATFSGYIALAKAQRDFQGKPDEAYKTVIDGLNRVQMAGSALPQALGFMRDTSELISKTPDAHRTASAQLLAGELMLSMLKLRAQCLTWPDLDELCADAFMTDDMKREQKNLQEQQKRIFQQKLNSKVDSWTGGR